MPLTQAAFRTAIGTKVAIDAPAVIVFSTPMERESVEAAISVVPAIDVSFGWDAVGKTVTVKPRKHWETGTYYTVTVAAGALGRSGRPTTEPVRAAFLTRAAASTVVVPSDPAGAGVAANSAFTISFDRAIRAETVGPSIRLEPAATGTVTEPRTYDGGTHVTFTPTAPLAPNTAYRFVVDGVLDADGVAVDPVAIDFRTSEAPTVLRFRPAHTAQDVARGANLSIRFSKPMDRASTKAALKVTANGKAITGKVTFAENDTVLVFDPKSTLGYHARVVATVATTAMSAEGAALAKPGQVAFRTIPKPAPVVTTSSSGGGGGGGAAAAAVVAAAAGPSDRGAGAPSSAITSD